MREWRFGLVDSLLRNMWKEICFDCMSTLDDGYAMESIYVGNNIKSSDEESNRYSIYREDTPKISILRFNFKLKLEKCQKSKN